MNMNMNTGLRHYEMVHVKDTAMIHAVAVAVRNF